MLVPTGVEGLGPGVAEPGRDAPFMAIPCAKDPVLLVAPFM